jgi:hypothetical protein
MLAAAGSAYNQSLDEIRHASVFWERRPGPKRRVVDVVCLVPDLPTFLEAIAAWDQSHAFPILIDDVELNLKFLRAFRPARIVRYPGKAAPIAAERLWDAAVSTVGRSWVEEAPGGEENAIPRGDSVPRRLGPTPPAAVLSSSSSAMFAGAVALAAGRFQPLLRWESGRNRDVLLTRGEAFDLALGLEARVADRFENYSRLEDECDFLTLAADGPYRYQDKDGPAAFDDLVARSPGSGRRWAFTGRLVGDLTASVYRAMCSLFLQPESTLLLNAYTERGLPWADYALTRTPEHLARFGTVTLREGTHAGLADWQNVFAPYNPFGLVLLNSSGSPTNFNLPGGPGQTGDIAPGGPAAVLMIHSFSASDPDDIQTIAGRWLANGAFIYFGALYEPYIQSFRPFGLVADLLADELPLGAALRRNPPEPFGQPWRLVYLGDPLYRLQATGRRSPRLAHWDPVAAWPAHSKLPPLDTLASDADRLSWALEAALDRLQRSSQPKEPLDLASVLLAMHRERLDASRRAVHDALLIDTLLEANRPDELLEQLWPIRGERRGSVVERAREPLVTAALAKLVATRDFPGASALWAKLLQTEPSVGFLQTITERVGALADTPGRRADWRRQLQAAKRGFDESSPLAAAIGAVLERTKD